jgi:K+-sensing histidine kinase KdpD
MARNKPPIEVNLDEFEMLEKKLLGKKKVKVKDSVVKIDSSLLNEVEAFINLDENKFRYVNRKQFIDIAVADYLRRMKK